MSRTLYNIRFDCQDNLSAIHSHNLWVEDYDIITSCPSSDPNHTLVQKVLLDTVSQDAKIVMDDISNTNGYYRATGLTYDVGTGPDSDYQVVGQYSLPYNVRIQGIIITPSTENIGDSFMFVAARNTAIGALTVGVTGGTLLEVTDSVITHINVGFDLNIVNGGTGQHLGECIAVNKIAKTITVEHALMSAYPPGSLLLIGVKRIENFRIANDHPIVFGSNNVGSTLVPAGLVGTILYKNETAVAKKISVIAEITY